MGLFSSASHAALGGVPDASVVVCADHVCNFIASPASAHAVRFPLRRGRRQPYGLPHRGHFGIPRPFQASTRLAIQRTEAKRP